MNIFKSMFGENVENYRQLFIVWNILFVICLLQTKGCYGVIRIEETKLVCAISRKVVLVEKHSFFA